MRIAAAVGLLEDGLARRVLVSGVNREASREDIRIVSRAVRRLYDCCVDLGFTAADTVGNARETADWARTMGYRSLIVVRAGAGFAGLEALCGRRAAINARDSHSGCNALAHTVAPLATAGGFFSGHVVTGAHVASLAAVRAGRADVCACDCVTFGLIARHSPASLAGLAVLGETAAAPAPPFITRGAASDAEVALWREALSRGLADPHSAGPRAFLGLAGVTVLDLAAYDRIGDMMTDLAVLGPLEES